MAYLYYAVILSIHAVFSCFHIYTYLWSLLQYQTTNNMKNTLIQYGLFISVLRHFHQKVIPKYHFKICVDCSLVIMRVRGCLVVTPSLPSLTAFYYLPSC